MLRCLVELFDPNSKAFRFAYCIGQLFRACITSQWLFCCVLEDWGIWYARKRDIRCSFTGSYNAAFGKSTHGTKEVDVQLLSSMFVLRIMHLSLQTYSLPEIVEWSTVTWRLRAFAEWREVKFQQQCLLSIILSYNRYSACNDVITIFLCIRVTWYDLLLLWWLN